MDELRFIRQIWLDEKHEFDDSLPRIYEAYLGYREAEARIEEADRQLEEAARRADELEKRCERASAALEAREKEFWSSGGDLSRNRDAIKQEIKRVSEDAEKAQEEILQLLTDPSTPLFL